jgi:hypothetical protein
MANPNGVSSTYDPIFISGGAMLAYENLSSNELTQFDIALKYATTIYDRYGTEPLSSILNEFKDPFLYVASIAKKYFATTFGGILSNSGFNMQPIRAATLLSQGAASPVYNWGRNFTTLGWQSLFGSDSSPFSLGTTGNGTAVTTTYKRVMIVAPVIIDLVPPKYDEIRVGISTVKYPVMPVTYTKVGNVYVTRFPAPLLLPADSQFFVEANIQELGSGSPRLAGFQFVTSDYAALK